jgi:hypothetical protein
MALDTMEELRGNQARLSTVHRIDAASGISA